MSRKDPRALRDDAQAAAAAGKHKRALECYVELERVEPADPQWPKRAGDMLRRLDKEREAVAAYDRAVERYAQSGFVVQAIAMCRLILQLDPSHSETVRRLAAMTEQQESGRTRIGALAAQQAQVVDDLPMVKKGATGAVPALRDAPAAATPAVAAAPPPMGGPELELELEPAPAAQPAPAPRAAPRPAPAPRAAAPTGSIDLSFDADPGAMEIERASGGGGRARRDSEIELDADDLESVQRMERIPAPRAPTPAGVGIPAPRPAAPPAPTRPPPAPPAPPAPPPRARRASGAPIKLAPGAPLDTVRLGRIAANALEQRRPDGTLSGIIEIPIDDELELIDDVDAPAPAPVFAAPAPAPGRPRAPSRAPEPEIDLDFTPDEPPVVIETGITAPPPVAGAPAPGAPARAAFDDDRTDEHAVAAVAAATAAPGDLAQPRAWSAGARRALAETPLLSGLGPAALEALLTRIGLVTLAPGETLFNEGDAGDALYIVVEGEVGVAREGPPRRAIARLGPGAFFGEVALVTEQPRTATVEAIVPTELLAIDRGLVSELVAEHPDVLFVILRFVRDRLLAMLMATSPLFAPMAPDDRRQLAARFRFVEIEAGSALVEEGARAAGLYVFLAGRADVRRGSELVRYLGAGDLAGESSVLHAQPSPVRIAAVTRCHALCLPAPEFREIMMTHPHVLEYVGDLVDAQRRALDGDASAATAASGFHLDII